MNLHVSQSEKKKLVPRVIEKEGRADNEPCLFDPLVGIRLILHKFQEFPKLPQIL